MFDLGELERALAVVHAAMPPTPAYGWPLLSQRLGAAPARPRDGRAAVRDSARQCVAL